MESNGHGSAPASDARPVSWIQFEDGSFYQVYQLPNGRQFVTTDDGERIYGKWYMGSDEPIPPTRIE